MKKNEFVGHLIIEGDSSGRTYGGNEGPGTKGPGWADRLLQNFEQGYRGLPDSLRSPCTYVTANNNCMADRRVMSLARDYPGNVDRVIRNYRGVLNRRIVTVFAISSAFSPVRTERLWQEFSGDWQESLGEITRYVRSNRNIVPIVVSDNFPDENTVSTMAKGRI